MNKNNMVVKLYANFIINCRWLVILLTLLTVFIIASGVKYLSFGSDYRQFFSKSNSQLEAFEKLQEVYTKTDNAIIIIKPKSGNIFQPDALKAIQQITKMGWLLPHISRVDSITNYQHSYAQMDNLIVKDLVEGNPHHISRESLENIRRIALSEPLVKGLLISNDGSTAGVNFTFNLPGDDPGIVPKVVAKIRHGLQEVRESYPSLEVRSSGIMFMNNAFIESSTKDMMTLTPMMYGVIIILIMIFLRSFFASVAVIFIISFSAICAMGFGGWMGVLLTSLSVNVPTIVLTLAIADSIHIIISMFKAMQNGMDKRNAIIESLRINMQPVFLTSITTMIGFLVLNFSDSPPFHDLGNMAAFGVAMAFLFSVTFLPAILSILPISTKRFIGQENSTTFIDKIATFVIGKRKYLLAVNFVVTIITVAMIFRIEISDDFVKYFDESIEFRRDSNFMFKNLTGIYNAEYSIESDGPGGVNKAEYLNKLDEYITWLRKQDEVLHVYSITDVIKRLNKNMHKDDKNWYRIPDDDKMSAQYLLLYEMSLPYGLSLTDRINLDKSATRVSVILDDLTTRQVLAFKKRSEEWLKNNAPDYMLSEPSSPVIMFSYIYKHNISNMIIGNIVAFMIISLSIGLILRNMKIGIISLIPNFIPIIIGYGLWAILIGQINLAASVAATISLGIIVDDTVHFLSKYLRARREKSTTNEEAVKYAFSTVGTALIITTIILICGFSVLTHSSFQMSSYMGMLTILVIGSALIVDFLLLPSLLLSMNIDFISKNKKK